MIEAYSELCGSDFGLGLALSFTGQFGAETMFPPELCHEVNQIHGINQILLRRGLVRPYFYVFIKKCLYAIRLAGQSCISSFSHHIGNRDRMNFNHLRLEDSLDSHFEVKKLYHDYS